MDITSKVAVVYSAARGIGKCYCEALLKAGCKVYFGDILISEGTKAEAEFKKTFPEGTVVFRKCDVLINAEVEELMNRTVKENGKVDIVIYNAAVIDEVNWQRCLEINLGGMMRVFSVAMTHMSAKCGGQGGDFIATSSLTGLVPVFMVPVYAATKHGIVGFIRSWGSMENYRITKIRCNCICPYTVNTKLVTALQPESMLLVEHSASMLSSIANLKEKELLVQPEEVADGLIRMLIEKDVNGKCLIVKKGERMYATFSKEME